MVKIRVEARPKIGANSIIRVKPGVQVESILLVNLFGQFKLLNLDYIDLKKIKSYTKLLGRFFLYNAILLALTKIFPK